jgi:hypothetical protein
MDDDLRREHLRQMDILGPHEMVDLDVDIAGGGALGGASLLVLAKMGCGVLNRITVTDFDVCEEHNLPNQWFGRSHVALGQSKVEALSEMVAFIGERNVVPVQGHFTGRESRRLGPIVLLTVDSLEERAKIWKNLSERTDVRFVIDARMGAHVVELFAVDMRRGDRAAYEQSLVVPEGGEYDEGCGERAIFYTVLGAASFVGSLLRAYCRNERFPDHLVFDFKHFMIQVPELAT